MIEVLRGDFLCNNCKTPLTDREKPIYCPFCGSSDIERI